MLLTPLSERGIRYFLKTLYIRLIYFMMMDLLKVMQESAIILNMKNYPFLQNEGVIMEGMFYMVTWFKIVDRNTLQRIETTRHTSLSYVELPSYVERIFVFRPLEIKVKPEDTWIYDDKWFRCKKR